MKDFGKEAQCISRGDMKSESHIKLEESDIHDVNVALAIVSGEGNACSPYGIIFVFPNSSCAGETLHR